MLIPLLPSRIHGLLDYLTGVIYILLPGIIGYPDSSAIYTTFMVAGIVIIVYSIMTRYEAGYIGLISMRTHLFFDLAAGLMLLSSSQVFDPAGHSRLIPLMGGALLIVSSLITNPRAEYMHGPKLKPDKNAKPLSS